MLLKRIAGKNYFVALLILLGVTILLVISIFILTALMPESLGADPDDYSISSVCDFEPWFFEIYDLSIYFPDGGIIATVGETDHKRSVMLLGEGVFRHNEREYDKDSAKGIFMVIGHDYFERIRGDNLFVPVEDRNQLDFVSAVFEQQKGIPTLWEDKIPITFKTQDDFFYFYFISSEGKPLLPPEVKYSSINIAGSAVVYILFPLITLVVITIFTLDQRYSLYWIHLAKNPPGFFSLGIIPFIAGFFAVSEIVPVIEGWPDLYKIFGYSVIIIFLIILARFNKIDYLDLGLRRDRIKHGYMLAVITSVLIIMTTKGLPGGIDVGGYETASHFSLLFLLIGLPREIIWRGYIQTFLSRQLGPNWGLFLMILLVAITRYLVILATEPWMIHYPYTYLEIAVLAPGTAAILGYLYLRTENVLSCALLHSLLIFLPSIIHY